jgi:hypothetical protein
MNNGNRPPYTDENGTTELHSKYLDLVLGNYHDNNFRSCTYSRNSPIYLFGLTNIRTNNVFDMHLQY